MQIAASLGPFDAMHVLALVADVSSAVVPSDFKLPVIPQAVVEYLATILLEREDPSGTADPANTPALRVAVQRAIGEIERLMSLTLDSHMIDSGYADSAMSRVSADLAFRDVLFRWPSYPDQERRALNELFAPFEVRQALKTELGFTAEEAVGLHDAMDQLLGAQRVGHARVHERLVADRVPLDPQLAALSKDQRRMLAVAMQLGPDLVDVWTVRETDLARASGKRWQTCDAYLNMLAVRFGEVKGTTLARGRSQVRSRPLVTDDGDRYLPTSVDNALRALRPALEAALPKAVFDGDYQPHRARWVEDSAVAALRRQCPRRRSGRTFASIWQGYATTRPTCSCASISSASSSR